MLDNGRYVCVGHAGAISCDAKCVLRSVLRAGGYDQPTWRLPRDVFYPFLHYLFALFCTHPLLLLKCVPRSVVRVRGYDAHTFGRYFFLSFFTPSKVIF